MRMTMRLAAVAVLVLAGGLSAGCLAVAAGAAAGGAIAYANGNAEAVIESDPERVLEQARTVFDEMQIEPVGEVEYSEQDQQWRLRGDTARSGPVRVTIRRLAPEVSKVWVRVGRFGDRDLSVTVLQRIRERL